MHAWSYKAILVLILGLTACAGPPGFDWPTGPLTDAERSALFTNVEPAESQTYGLTPDDAIRIGRYGPSKGIQAAREMIARLRLEGRPLTVISRMSIRVAAPGSADVEPAPYGVPSGETIVDAYVVTSEAAADTLRLYFDAYYAAPLRVPVGLEWSEAP